MNTMKNTKTVSRLADEDAPIIMPSNGESLSPLEVGLLTDVVAQTASYVSVTGRVEVVPGQNWSATIDGSRTITFSPYSMIHLSGDRMVYVGGEVPGKCRRVISRKELAIITTHEGLHLVYTGKFDPPQPVGANASKHHRWVNSFEDIRIDRLGEAEYPLYRRLRPEFTRAALRQIWYTDQFADLHPLDQVWTSYFGIDVGIGGEIPDGVPGLKDFVAKWSDTYFEACDQPSTQDAVNVAFPIFVDLMDNLVGQDECADDKSEQQSNPDPLDRSDSKPVFGDDQPEEAGGDTAAGTEESIDDSSDGVDDELSPEGLNDTDEDECDSSDPDGPEDEDDDGWGDAPYVSDGSENGYMDDDSVVESARRDASNGALYEQAKNNRIDRTAARSVTSASKPKEDWSPEQMREYGAEDARWEAKKAKYLPTINVLSHRIRATLKNNAMDAYVGGNRRGRLDTKQAKKAAAGNNRIFRRRDAVGKTDYTVAILIDTSDSMARPGRYGIKGRRKPVPTLDATIIAAEALEKAGVKTIICTWDTTVGALKTADIPLAKAQHAIASAIAESRGGTQEITGLEAVRKHIKAASGQKIIIQITDGATSRLEESVQLLNEFKAAGIESVGIGVTIDPPGHYEHKVHCENADDLVTALPEALRKMIRRG